MFSVVFRFALRLLACCLFGCFLAGVVVVMAVVIATITYGNLDQLLENPPMTRAFLYGFFGYVGAAIAALVARIFSGLLRIGSTHQQFKSSIWREVLPSGGIGALLGLVAGLGVAHWNLHGKSDAAIYTTVETDLLDTIGFFGIAAGIVAVVCVRNITAYRQNMRQLSGGAS